jgi:putative cell wall-binding protein
VESPILLAGWKLTDAQLALLRTVRGKRIIVGGENAVSAKVAAWIRSTGETVRVAGSDRYETSLLLAKMYFSDPAKAVLVYGDNFPDGISAGPLANALKAPVLLVKDSKADVLAQFNASHSITVGYVLGGQKLLANDTVRTIFDMEANAPIKVCK